MRGWLVLFFVLVSLSASAGQQDTAYRWQGHDFVFCFVTDDGRSSNLAWADTARAMDFRFTMAVNVKNKDNLPPYTTLLSDTQMHSLYEDGFEIAEHGYSHGSDGLPDSCYYRGSLQGYFLCNEPDEATRMTYLHAEIERDSLANLVDMPLSMVRTVAYPKHLHGKALIDSLRAEGYIGARTGGKWDYVMTSTGDFTVVARNSWDEGISLYRVPISTTANDYFGNHSADPPVHKTYAEFLAVAQSWVNNFKSSGGMMILYAHHTGDDDDSLGDINYGTGGVTKQDLAWIVQLVRDNGGIVMPFGEAVAYYRARTGMVDMDGDLVWKPGVSSVPRPVESPLSAVSGFPNPFNPRTMISYELGSAQQVKVSVFDAAGRLIANLFNAPQGPGEYSLPWDGRAGNGRPVSGGLYFVRVQAGDWQDILKITMLK